MNKLFSFIYSTSYSFEGKKEGEEVIIFLHRHWFTIVSKVFFIVVGAFLPFIILGIMGKTIASLQLLTLYTAVWAAYYMVLWYALFYSFTMYTLDTWIVTNMRIINSVQNGFFNRNVSELSLEKIQDVAHNVEGPLATLLNYGDINVQTAGSERHFIFEQAPNPQYVKDTVMHQVAIKRREAEENLGRELREEIFGETV